MKRLAWIPVCVALAALGSLPARSQAYPSRSVVIEVPFAPGGGTDLLARLVAQKLEAKLGRPFVIENRPGAGTIVAAMTAVRAPHDGYTLMHATSSTMAINVSTYKQLPYEPLKDLVPVALLSASPFFLVVSPSMPVKSVGELIALAKEKPGSLNYGSGGLGSMHHLSTELLLNLTGTRMTHVPYRGTPQATTDLLAGNIQVLFGDATSLLPLIQQGTVRALGVSTAERVEAAPDVPTVAEAGVPGFESSSWHMLTAPGRTPPEVVTLLNREVKAIFSDPAVKQELTRRGVGPKVTGTPEELHAFVQREIARWGDIVRRAGIAGSL